MDGRPPDQVMIENERLVPWADGHAPAAAGKPFFLVHSPEGETAVGPDIPLSEARVIEYGAGRLSFGKSMRNSIGRETG